MVKDKKIIKENIEHFKLDNGGDYPEYYIGITSNPERRLVEDVENEELNEHIKTGIYDGNSVVCVEETKSREVAVEIEHHFQRLGMKKYNPRSKGVKTTKFVYCFKIAKDSELLKENEDLEFNGNSKESKEMRRQINKIKDFAQFKNDLKPRN